MAKFIVYFLMVSCLSTSTWVANDISGVWLNKDKDAHVKIYGSYGKYYGQIVWLKIPNDPDTQKPKLDKHNSDAKLKTRAILNLNILTGLVFDADDQEWGDGEVYDPKTGSTYSVECSLKDKNTMELRGYMGISLFGRTDIWTRVTQ